MPKINCLDCGKTIKNFDGSQTCCNSKTKPIPINLDSTLNHFPQIEEPI